MDAKYKALPKTKKTESEQRELLRKLWAIDGVIKHQYDVRILETILIDFQRIDQVPNGYKYPKLFKVKEVKFDKKYR